MNIININTSSSHQLSPTNMHPAPRTIYDNDVDFATLARQDLDFNK